MLLEDTKHSEKFSPFLAEGSRNCMLISQDGYRIPFKKELLIHTEFMRSILKCSHCCGVLDIICPLSKKELDPILDFFQTGQIPCTSQDDTSKIMKDLCQVFGFRDDLSLTWIPMESSDLAKLKEKPVKRKTNDEKEKPVTSKRRKLQRKSAPSYFEDENADLFDNYDYPEPVYEDKSVENNFKTETCEESNDFVHLSQTHSNTFKINKMKKTHKVFTLFNINSDDLLEAPPNDPELGYAYLIKDHHLGDSEKNGGFSFNESNLKFKCKLYEHLDQDFGHKRFDYHAVKINQCLDGTLKPSILHKVKFDKKLQRFYSQDRGARDYLNDDKDFVLVKFASCRMKPPLEYQKYICHVIHAPEDYDYLKQRIWIDYGPLKEKSLNYENENEETNGSNFESMDQNYESMERLNSGAFEVLNMKRGLKFHTLFNANFDVFLDSIPADPQLGFAYMIKDDHLGPSDKTGGFSWSPTNQKFVCKFFPDIDVDFGIKRCDHFTAICAERPNNGYHVTLSDIIRFEKDSKRFYRSSKSVGKEYIQNDQDLVAMKYFSCRFKEPYNYQKTVFYAIHASDKLHHLKNRLWIDYCSTIEV